MARKTIGRDIAGLATVLVACMTARGAGARSSSPGRRGGFKIPDLCRRSRQGGQPARRAARAASGQAFDGPRPDRRLVPARYRQGPGDPDCRRARSRRRLLRLARVVERRSAHPLRRDDGRPGRPVSHQDDRGRRRAVDRQGPRHRQLPDLLARRSPHRIPLQSGSPGRGVGHVPDGSQRETLGSYGRPRWSPYGHQMMMTSFSSPCSVTIMDANPEKSGRLQVPGNTDLLGADLGGRQDARGGHRIRGHHRPDRHVHPGGGSDQGSPVEEGEGIRRHAGLPELLTLAPRVRLRR